MRKAPSCWPQTNWRSDRGIRRLLLAAALVATCLASPPELARADEGGVGFWLPGQFGSLAAAPQVPGWALGIINYYTSVNASGGVAAAREITIGKLSPTVRVDLDVNLKAAPDLLLVVPTYVFATPVFGGQFAVSVGEAVGQTNAGIEGMLTANVGPFGATRQGAIGHARGGFSDLYPQSSLRWNNGINNWMIYMMGDVPIGSYNSNRLANFGIGHGALDGGAGYTYFNPGTGYEFSVVSGLTGNFTNPSTGYTNGIDWHVDWGASQFVTKTMQLGAVGYFYQQVTPDRGAVPILGNFESRVAAVGPQIGFIIPAGPMQAYLNFKAYVEFAAENRPVGWNAWVTLAFSSSPPASGAASGMAAK